MPEETPLLLSSPGKQKLKLIKARLQRVKIHGIAYMDFNGLDEELNK